MIREYENRDLSELLDAWYSASQVAHPFLDEDFFEQERRNIAAIYLPNAETWVYEMDSVVCWLYAAQAKTQLLAVYFHRDLGKESLGL